MAAHSIDRTALWWSGDPDSNDGLRLPHARRPSGLVRVAGWHQRQLGVWPAVHAKGAHPTALDHLGKDFLSYREGGPGGAEAGGAGAAED